MTYQTTAIGYEKNLPITDPSSLIERTIQVPAPLDHDLLVEVRAVSVNPVDVKLRAHASARGLRVLGFDAAGVVQSVGSAVTLFKPGDEVYYAGRSTGRARTSICTWWTSASWGASRGPCRSAPRRRCP